MTHYRSPMDWTEEKARWNNLRGQKAFVDADHLRERARQAGLELRAIPQGVVAEMHKDFDPAKLETLA
jgi:hypothetical protein